MVSHAHTRMNTPNREKEIFDAALEIALPAERAAFVDRACGGDAQLAERIRALIAADEEATDFLPGEPGVLATDAKLAPLSEGPGTIIDPLQTSSADWGGRFRCGLHGGAA